MPINPSVEAFLNRIRSGDRDSRAAAVADAIGAGVDAIVPLADIMAGEDLMAARAAQESLRRIGYHCGGKGGDAGGASQNLPQLNCKDPARKGRRGGRPPARFVSQP